MSETSRANHFMRIAAEKAAAIREKKQKAWLNTRPLVDTQMGSDGKGGQMIVKTDKPNTSHLNMDQIFEEITQENQTDKK